MTTEWIAQYNKKCAEFLGAYWCNDDLNAYPSGYWMLDGEDNLPHDLEHMEFHSDWNWIMEVIDAIENLNRKDFWNYNEIKICRNYIDISYNMTIRKRYTFSGDYSKQSLSQGNLFKIEHFKTKKEAVIQAIDQFIDWYNKQKES